MIVTELNILKQSLEMIDLYWIWAVMDDFHYMYEGLYSPLRELGPELVNSMSEWLAWGEPIWHKYHAFEFK